MSYSAFSGTDSYTFVAFYGAGPDFQPPSTLSDAKTSGVVVGTWSGDIYQSDAGTSAMSAASHFDSANCAMWVVAYDSTGFISSNLQKTGGPSGGWTCPAAGASAAPPQPTTTPATIPPAGKAALPHTILPGLLIGVVIIGVGYWMVKS